MEKSDTAAREIILETTISLIEKHGDAGKIKIRDIAEKANVGTGLINYHFQTKENLINQCVQRMIGRIIERFEPMYKSLNMEPKQKFKTLAKSTAAFLAANPGISRISILNDLMAGKAGDNTCQTFAAYLPVLKEVCGDKKSDHEIALILHVFISAIQSAFLRNEVIRSSLGCDFFDADHRNSLVENIIDSLFPP